MSKIIANRLKRALPNITHRHQFVNPPNTIGKLNLILREISVEMRKRNKGALVSVDFKKAYDTVDHEFMQAALEQAGFGENFKTFFKTIYDQGKAKVSVNGEIGESIKLKGGIKQGDPMSMYLFTIVTDTLLQKRNQLITGYKLAGMRETLTTPSYADDVTVALAREDQAQHEINIIGDFGRASGLQINHQKTNGISFERRKQRTQATSIKLAGDIEILGNSIAHEEHSVTQNWTEAMNKASRLLRELDNMYLKRYEKNAILRTNVLPIFTYIASTSKMPGNIRSQIRAETTRFLLGMEKRIDYAKITQPKEKGGLGMIDIITMADLAFTKPAIEYLQKAD